jgi:hypothetical protein
MGSCSEIGFWQVAKEYVRGCSGQLHGRNQLAATGQVPFHQAGAGRFSWLRTVNELFYRFRVEPEFAGDRT